MDDSPLFPESGNLVVDACQPQASMLDPPDFGLVYCFSNACAQTLALMGGADVQKLREHVVQASVCASWARAYVVQAFAGACV